jgi:SAM-dependent methyltransferase
MTDGQVDWPGWLASWDRQQEHLLPDREERFAAMFGVVEAVAGPPRRVLDLACGPGSITVRLLRRFPEARATLVDVDAALLAIAEGVLGGDARVQIMRADLADPGWAKALPAGDYDAVLTANSLHWLPEPALRRVYADLAGLIRAGGVACNADSMTPDGADRLIDALERHAHQVQPALPEGELDWEDWWHAAAADPVLAPLVAERNERFGGETHPPAFTPPLAWHTAALREAGFTEAGCVWRHGIGAIVAALR